MTPRSSPGEKASGLSSFLTKSVTRVRWLLWGLKAGYDDEIDIETEFNLLLKLEPFVFSTYFHVLLHTQLVNFFIVYPLQLMTNLLWTFPCNSCNWQFLHQNLPRFLRQNPQKDRWNNILRYTQTEKYGRGPCEQTSIVSLTQNTNAYQNR